MPKKPPLTQEQKNKFIESYRKMIGDYFNEAQRLKLLSDTEAIDFNEITGSPEFSNETSKHLPRELRHKYTSLINKFIIGRDQ